MRVSRINEQLERGISIFQLAPTFPSFDDLTERSADFTPRFASCDARVVFRFQFGALARRDPLFQMQLADFLPCIRRGRGFGCCVLCWFVSVITASVRVKFLLCFNRLCRFVLLSKCVIELSAWTVSAIRPWLWLEVNPT